MRHYAWLFVVFVVVGIGLVVLKKALKQQGENHPKIEAAPSPFVDKQNILEGTEFVWPTKGELTSGYGWRWGRMHQGIDIAAPVGTPVVAAAPGTVTYSQWNDGGYGYSIEIFHPEGSWTFYAHNDSNSVSVGEWVERGQKIAEMGNTGRSTGPHLHFEVHRPKEGAIDPLHVLPQFPREAEQ